MTMPKPLDAVEVVNQAADVAAVQFDMTVTDAQRESALQHVLRMSTRKYAEDTNLVVGIVIGWSSAGAA